MAFRSTILLAVLGLMGCASGGHGLPGDLSAAEQAFVAEARAGNEELLYGLAESEREAFAAMIIRAERGESDALSDLFAMSVAGLDGAAAEGYASYLGSALHAAGDTRFGDTLSRESAAVQEAVRDLLSFDLGVPEYMPVWEARRRYPQTFPTDTLVYTFDSCEGDPYKGGGFVEALAEYLDQQGGVGPVGTEIVDLNYVAIPRGEQQVYLVSYDWQTDWWGSWGVFGVGEQGRIAWEAGITDRGGVVDEWNDREPGSQSIDTVRVLLLEGQRNPMLEVIGTTHMGNGSLYLYELDGRTLRLVLTTKALDRNHGWEWIEGGLLKRELRDLNGDGCTDIRLHGRGTVVTEQIGQDENGQEILVSSDEHDIELEKIYLWDPATRLFVTDESSWLWFDQARDLQARQ